MLAILTGTGNGTSATNAGSGADCMLVNLKQTFSTHNRNQHEMQEEIFKLKINDCFVYKLRVPTFASDAAMAKHS